MKDFFFFKMSILYHHLALRAIFIIHRMNHFYLFAFAS